MEHNVEQNPWQAPVPDQLPDESHFRWREHYVVVSVECVPVWFPFVDQFNVNVDGQDIECNKLDTPLSWGFSLPKDEEETYRGFIEV